MRAQHPGGLHLPRGFICDSRDIAMGVRAKRSLSDPLTPVGAAHWQLWQRKGGEASESVEPIVESVFAEADVRYWATIINPI